MTVDRVMVPLDASPLAELALPKAIELLSGPRATVILLRAAHAPMRPGVDPIDAQVTVVREAESYLAAIAARLGDQGLTRVSVAEAVMRATRTPILLVPAGGDDRARPTVPYAPEIARPSGTAAALAASEPAALAR